MLNTMFPSSVYDIVPGMPCSPSGRGNAVELPHEEVVAPRALASSSHEPEISHEVEVASEGVGEIQEGEDTWTEDPVDTHHVLTRLPKSRKCPICLQAKLYEAPHRRSAHERAHLRDIRDIEEPTAPLERIACDHVISRTSIGIGGNMLFGLGR